METTYTIGQMAAKLHKAVRTLQQWDRDGILVSSRTPTNRRYYTHKQLLDYFCIENDKQRNIVVYCRVSSQAQKPELKNQVQALTEFCLLKDYTFEIIEEIGGGMNFSRKKFQELMKRVCSGEVSKIIVAHKDRLTRFGFEYFDWQCKQFDCQIEVLNNEKLSPQEEMVQDLMTVIHCFSSRLYGLRNYKKDLKKALKS